MKTNRYAVDPIKMGVDLTGYRDSTVELQNTIDFAIANNMTVQFPECCIKTGKITIDNEVKLVNGLAYGDLRNVTPIYITAHKQEPSDMIQLDSIYVEIFKQ